MLIEADHAHNVTGLHLHKGSRAGYPLFRNVPLRAIPHHALGLLKISWSGWMLCSTASL